MDIYDLIEKRQSDRAYDSSRTVEPEKIERIVSAVRLAPSACNSQPWHLIVVDDPEKVKVVAEAMACGTPVIAFDSTANSELVTEECGFLVPIADTLALKTAYKTVRKNGKEFYSEKCRQFAEENFDMTKQIEKYVEIYKRIICK